MSTSVVSPPNARARSVDFDTDTVVFHLEDGRSVSAPLEWFPRLRDATPEQRRHWELIGPGFGVRWPEIDEDISVAGLLGLPD
jgi:hypothetical protein